eukprot:gb/GECG01006688.1/.p1 GENE.gb/GECG01006688.1/~~gb/GECG01006688.1/.p1  ORF type:complete len:267 (+),score=33.96 gb/GECG01006688.1/:1-801(+)
MGNSASKRGVPKQEKKLSASDLTRRINTAAKSGSLKLSGCKLKEIPPQIFGLDKLRVLDLSHNKLETIPDEIRKLTGLKKLYLSYNPLKHVPHLDGLENLVEVDVSFCELKSIPRLPTALKSLNACYNKGIKTDNVTSAPKLESLNLSGCQMKNVPGHLGELSKLQDFNVSNNDLVSLGGIEDWAKLPDLQSVIAEGNEIHADESTIPRSLLEDTRLHKLTLTGNPITQKQIQTLPGADSFLERRKERIDKGISTLQDRSLCGLST